MLDCTIMAFDKNNSYHYMIYKDEMIGQLILIWSLK